MSLAKRVFITGGTGTVGCELVKAFTDIGQIVFFQYFSNADDAKALSEATKAEGLRMDLKGKVSIEELDIDVLVNCAGINICDELSALVGEKVWDETIAVNTTAPFQLVRSTLPGMIKRKWGRIINISSIYGIRGVEANLPYTVSKHALSGLTKTVAKEYAALGVTSNEICPGAIESKMMNEISKRASSIDGGTPEEYLQGIRDLIPARRFAFPAEIAHLAVFLASDKAAYINGVSIPLDGGLVA
jgi:NAD(P)-dependent dehydrogenase (short-subunit alcohol dehydrogenase family)